MNSHNEEEQLTSFKESLHDFDEELNWGEDYLKSVNHLNNWLLGIPTTTLLLLLVNFNFFIVDGELYKPNSIIGLLLINAIIVVVFGFFKLIYEVYKVNLEFVKMQYDFIARKGDKELREFIKKVTEECRDPELTTQKEIRTYLKKKKNEMKGISDEYGDKTFELILRMISLKKTLLFSSFLHKVIYFFALLPLIGGLVYVSFFVIENH